MGDRFYCQRDNLTLSLQPDRRPKTQGTPTYFQTPPEPLYPIPGKVYTFKGVEKVWQNGWVLVTPVPVVFPDNPRIGQVSKQNGKDFVFLSKKGWIEVSELSFF